MFPLVLLISSLHVWQSSGITLLQSNTWRRRRTSLKSNTLGQLPQESNHRSLNHSLERQEKATSFVQTHESNAMNEKLNSYISSILSKRKPSPNNKNSLLQVPNETLTYGSWITPVAKNSLAFDLTSCLLDAAQGHLGNLAYEATQTCSHTFSCVGSFQVDQTLQVLLGSFCLLNAYEQNTPPDIAVPLNEGYINFLHSYMIPIWQSEMDLVSMVPEQRTVQYSSMMPPDIPRNPLHKTERKFGAGSIEKSKAGMGYLQQEDCLAEQSGMKKLKCMMGQLGAVFDATNGRPKMSNLQMTDTDAAKMRSNMGKLHTGLQLVKTVHSSRQQKAKLRALEQGGESGGIMNMYNTPADDYPIPGPLNNSLINPPSKTKYSHIAPGLPMIAHKLADVIPEAVCNDGSSALYYLHEGEYEGKYHFHISGGYFCNSPQNCRKRIRGSPMLASTAGYEDQYDGSGVFDPYLGGLQGWTHAYVTYCSSDAWFGQVELGFQVIENTFIGAGKKGTFFRGYTMITAMLKKYAMMGLGDGPGHELVVSGCSAGGIGLAAQSDSLLGRLEEEFTAIYPDKVFTSPKIITVMDNMPVINPTPMALNFNGNVSLFEQSQRLVNMLYVEPDILGKASHFLNPFCVLAYPDNPAACVFPEMVMPHIQVYNLVMNNMQDSFLMFNPYATGSPKNTEQERWMYSNEKYLRAVINMVTPQQNQWAVTCNDHCLMLFAAWWRMVPPSAPRGWQYTSAKDMMIMTINGDTGHIAMDDCHSFNCGCAGSGPFYFFGMLGQYCAQKRYNSPIGMVLDYPNQQQFDTYLRLPKDPDEPPEEKGASMLQIDHTMDSSSLLEVSQQDQSGKPHTKGVIETLKTMVMGPEDPCPAYHAVVAAQIQFSISQDAELTGALGGDDYHNPSDPSR